MSTLAAQPGPLRVLVHEHVVLLRELLVAVSAFELFDVLVDLLHVLVAVSKLRKRFSAAEGADERFLLAVGPDVVVELGQAGEHEVLAATEVADEQAVVAGRSLGLQEVVNEEVCALGNVALVVEVRWVEVLAPDHLDLPV